MLKSIETLAKLKTEFEAEQKLVHGHLDKAMAAGDHKTAKMLMTRRQRVLKLGTAIYHLELNTRLSKSITRQLKSIAERTVTARRASDQIKQIDNALRELAGAIDMIARTMNLAAVL